MGRRPPLCGEQPARAQHHPHGCGGAAEQPAGGAQLRGAHAAPQDQFSSLLNHSVDNQDFVYLHLG